jgi:hypothetical protein
MFCSALFYLLDDNTILTLSTAAQSNWKAYRVLSCVGILSMSLDMLPFLLLRFCYLFLLFRSITCKISFIKS